jgi:PAS domain S-box-containing protein
MKPALLKEAEAASEFRILILELAPAVAADLTSFLASLGYQVVGCARCLEEGVDLVVELHPDLLLAEFRVEGGSSGLDIALELRGRFGKPVVCVARGDGDEVVRRLRICQESGLPAAPLLGKELRSAIDMACYKHRMDAMMSAQRDLALKLAMEVEPGPVLDHCLSAALAQPGLECGAIYLKDESSGALVLQSHRGLSSGFVAAVSHCPADSDKARLVGLGRPVYATHGQLGLSHSTAELEEGLRAVAVLPVVQSAQILGCMNVASRRMAEIPVGTRTILEHLVHQMGSAIARARSMLQLKERELQLHMALEASGMATWDWDIGSGRVRWSRMHEVLWGFAPGEFTGHYRDFESRVFPEDLPGLHETGERALRDLSVFRHDYRVVWPDGTIRWMTSQGHHLRDVQGKPYRMLGVVFDITERKRSESLLRQSEARYRALVEYAGEAIYVVRSGRILFINRFGAAFFGTDESAAIGRSVLDWVREEDRAGLAALDEKRLADQVAGCQATCRVPAADGTERWLLVNAVRIDWEGSPAVLNFGQDITAYRQLEIKLRESQKLESIGQLAGGVAHDFNNILAATLMNLGMLQQDAALDPEIRRSLQELTKDAKRASSLTRQLLLYSRRAVMDIKVIDLNEIVANLLKMLGRLIGEDVNLVFEPASLLPGVEADAGMLEQVVMNLAVNARDAMPHGGEIRIGTRVLEIPERAISEFSEARPGRFVCLTVKDTGVGMDSATVKRIFEPFFTTKEPGKGTGLGLATVQGVVAQHHGWIEVSSQPGQGTIFRIFLPALASAVGSTGNDADEPACIRRGHEAILLVEDDPGLRDVLAIGLRMAGYRVLTATNGQDALRVWAENRDQVQLLFSDMVMPGGMTGVELATQLRAERPDLKVIICSGYSPDITRADLLPGKHMMFLQKPVAANHVWESVRRHLDSP